MSLYMVIVDQTRDDVWEAVKTGWPDDHRIHNDLVAFIKAENTLTEEIAQAIGLAGVSTDASGIVVQLDYFSGRMKSATVEWVQKNRDDK